MDEDYNAGAVNYALPYDVDAATIRNVRYATAEDAQAFLEEAGLYSFSEVVYFPDEDSFGISVNYQEPA